MDPHTLTLIQKTDKVFSMNKHEITCLVDECIGKLDKTNHIIEQSDSDFTVLLDEILYGVNKLSCTIRLADIFGTYDSKLIDVLHRKVIDFDTRFIQNRLIYSKITERISQDRDDRLLLSILARRHKNSGIPSGVEESVKKIDEQIEELAESEASVSRLCELYKLKNMKSALLGHTDYYSYCSETDSEPNNIFGVPAQLIDLVDPSIKDSIHSFVKQYTNIDSPITYDDITKSYIGAKKQLCYTFVIDFAVLLKRIIDIITVFFNITVKKNVHKLSSKECYVLEIYKDDKYYGSIILDPKNSVCKPEIVVIEWRNIKKDTYPSSVYLFDYKQRVSYSNIIDIMTSMCRQIQYVLSENSSEHIILNSTNLDKDIEGLLPKVFSIFLLQSEIICYLVPCKDNILKDIQIACWLDEVYNMFDTVNKSILDNILSSNKDIELHYNILKELLDTSIFDAKSFAKEKNSVKTLYYNNGNYVANLFVIIVAYDIYYNRLENVSKLFDIKVSTNKRKLIRDILGRNTNISQYINIIKDYIEKILSRLSINVDMTDVYSLFQKVK